MNLNGILIGSQDPKRLIDYYTRLFGEPGWSGGDFVGWQLGGGYVTVGPHDQVQAPTLSRAGSSGTSRPPTSTTTSNGSRRLAPP